MIIFKNKRSSTFNMEKINATLRSILDHEKPADNEVK